MNRYRVLAILLPFLALALQWLLWPWLSPFVGFLFFPTVFFSARLGGLISTASANPLIFNNLPKLSPAWACMG